MHNLQTFFPHAILLTFHTFEKHPLVSLCSFDVVGGVGLNVFDWFILHSTETRLQCDSPSAVPS